MADDFAKVRTGEPLAIPARAYNALMEVAREYLDSQHSRRGSVTRQPPQSAIIKVRNDSAEARSSFEVLKLNGVVFTETDNLPEFQRRAAYKGIVPTTTTDIVCILLEPCAVGAYARAVVAGIATVQVDVTDEDHEFANPTEDDASQLTSGATGLHRILYKPEGTGTLWCKVRLADGSGGTGGDEIEFVKCTSATATSSRYPAILQDQVAGSGGLTDDITGTLTPISTDTGADTVTFAFPAWATGTVVQPVTTGGGLTAGTKYWVNLVSASTNSFHTSLADAQADTNRVNLTANITSAIDAVQVWLRFPNNEVPIDGTKYAAVMVASEATHGLDIYQGIGLTLTVRELDGTPSVSGVSIITCDSADGLRVFEAATGEARLDLLSASATQVGVVDLAANQILGAGDKKLSAGSDMIVHGTNGKFRIEETGLFFGEMLAIPAITLAGGAVALTYAQAGPLGATTLVLDSNRRAILTGDGSGAYGKYCLGVFFGGALIDIVEGETGNFRDRDGNLITVSGGIITDLTTGAAGSTAITTLNTLTGATQTFADVDDTNVTLTISSAGTAHTFTLGWTGTLAATRGGTGADLSAGTGFVKMATGTGSVVNGSAYTQTYSTASATHADFTSATLTDSTGAKPGTDIADVSGSYSQTILNDNFSSLTDQVNKLRVDLENAKQVINRLIDDLQASGYAT